MFDINLADYEGHEVEVTLREGCTYRGVISSRGDVSNHWPWLYAGDTGNGGKERLTYTASGHYHTGSLPHRLDIISIRSIRPAPLPTPSMAIDLNDLLPYRDEYVEITMTDGRHGIGKLTRAAHCHPAKWTITWEAPFPTGSPTVNTTTFFAPGLPPIQRITKAKRTVINWITHHQPTAEDGYGNYILLRDALSLMPVFANIDGPQLRNTPDRPWAHHLNWQPLAPTPSPKQTADERITALEALVGRLQSALDEKSS